MNTLIVAVLASAALAAPALAQQPDMSKEPSATTQAAGSIPAHKGGKGGKHPHIHHAKHALENASKQLEQAAHDYGGHRSKALELTKQAVQEVDAALQYAKDHPEQK